MRSIVNLHKYITLPLFVTTVILFGLLSGCSNPQEEKIQETEAEHSTEKTQVDLSEAQYKMAEIKLGKVEKRNLSNVLKVSGIMDAPPQNLTSISAPMGGFVMSTKLLQGMQVKKGEVLAVMQHPDYVQLQQDYLDKKSKLEYIEQEYNRQEELYKENVSSGKVFQQAKSNYSSMKAQVKGLQEKLAIIGIDADKLNEDNLSRNLNIYSPINGYVSVVNVNLGKYVNPTDVMFEIVNTEHLHAELTVYEKDISKLKEGQKVRLSLPFDNTKERLAFIYLIGRKIDKERAVQVHAHLKNEYADLLPGMYINATIELNENKVDAVPEEAIVISEGKHFIYILKNETTENNEKTYHFEMIEVQTGVTENDYTEISLTNNRSTDNLEIVSNGAFSLLSMMKNSEEEEGGHGH